MIIYGLKGDGIKRRYVLVEVLSGLLQVCQFLLSSAKPDYMNFYYLIQGLNSRVLGNCSTYGNCLHLVSHTTHYLFYLGL